MANLIQFKRGDIASIPTLSAGEPGFATDTKNLYCGDGATNYLFPHMESLTLTAGRIPFVGSSNGLAQSASLVWDDTAASLGIGGSPSTGCVEITNADAANKKGLVIDHNETGAYPALLIDSEANDNAALIYGKYGLCIFQDISNGRGLYVTRNLNEAGSEYLASFIDDHANNTKDTVYIQHDGSGYALNAVGNAYFSANVSALSFTDRTPMFTGDALSEIKGIKALPNGELDHNTLPSFAHVIKKEKKVVEGGVKEGVEESTVGGTVEGVSTKKYEEEVETSYRDIGAMVSILTVAIQQLSGMVDKLETKVKELEGK